MAVDGYLSKMYSHHHHHHRFPHIMGPTQAQFAHSHHLHLSLFLTLLVLILLVNLSLIQKMACKMAKQLEFTERHFEDC